ncbi:hypothetical protein B0T21DRAFT_375483 [Apiosordaria backusii]|uniref:Uncharacterized protein n=1 Tax=Apiosordaria backusii TaxID=314023 RepID=A0AA40DV26_9PEZI|nr:hypothetical protein B0T21DRAFT_375483 [Apiosordaria backusii]
MLVEVSERGYILYLTCESAPSVWNGGTEILGEVGAILCWGSRMMSDLVQHAVMIVSKVHLHPSICQQTLTPDPRTPEKDAMMDRAGENVHISLRPPMLNTGAPDCWVLMTWPTRLLHPCFRLPRKMRVRRSIASVIWSPASGSLTFSISNGQNVDIQPVFAVRSSRFFAVCFADTLGYVPRLVKGFSPLGRPGERMPSRQ